MMVQKTAASSTCYQSGAHEHDHDHGRDHAHAHGHDHDHAHGHAHVHKPAGAGADRAFILALLVTAGFALVELIGGLYAHSLALISDAGHMVTDAAALFIGLMAARLAQRPASASKSYGYGRAEVIGAFVNGLVMLAVVVWIMVEAVERLLAPQPVAGWWVMGIAAAGLIANLLVLGVLSRGQEGGDASGHHHNLNSRAAVLHVMGDLLGSVAAIVAGAVVTFTGWTLIDPLLSIAVSLLILRSTWQLLLESVNVLMEAVPEGLDYHAVERRLGTIAGVTAVHDLHVWQMGSEGRALSAHILIDSHEAWPRVLEEARGVLRREFGTGHVTLQPVWPQLVRHDHHAQHGHGHAQHGHAHDHGHDHQHTTTPETGTHGKGQSA